MNGLTLAFVVAVLAIGAFLIFTGPKRYAIPFVIAMYLGLYGGIADIMGRSKPILIPDRELVVIGFHFDEGRAIHVWTLEDEPRAYRLAWNIGLARQLRDAAGRADGRKGALLMRRGVPEGEATFYPAPPREMPPKEGQ